MPRDPVKLEPVEGLWIIAREALDFAKGDEMVAVKLMKARVHRDPMQLDAALDLACRTIIINTRTDQNRAAWVDRPARVGESAPAPIDLTQRGARMRALIPEHRLLMELRLPNGTVLGEAKKHDLEEAVEWYQKRIDTEAHKVRWFKAIARRIDGRRVREVLDEPKLRKLQKDTEDE